MLCRFAIVQNKKSPAMNWRSFFGEFRAAKRKSRSITYGVALDFGFGLGSNDADEFAAFVALNLKYDFAVCRCKQGVILADTHVVAGMEMRAALTNDDIAGFDGFAAEAFHA
jgi:hypothetical protein